MRKAIVLTSLDVKALTDIFEYLDCDDKEKDDFKEQYGEELFNEQDELMLDQVPSPAKSHIYFLTEYMRNELFSAENS
jgi:hypothetical protein